MPKEHGIKDVEILPIASSRAGEKFVLLICDRIGNQIQRFVVDVVVNNKVKVSSIQPIDPIAVQKPMSIAIDRDRNLWIGTSETPPQIRVFDRDGKQLDKNIELDSVAADLAIRNDELWVAKKTVPIPIYDIKGNLSGPSRYFGKSVRDVTPPGSLTAEVVTLPRAIGFDGKGNVYTMSSEARTSYIASYNSVGRVRWRMVSNAFAISGGLTPDGNSIYSGRARLEFDGSRWNTVSVTYDPISYPDDPRRLNEDIDSVRVFDHGRSRFVYIFLRAATALYRKDADSEILRPVGLLNCNASTRKYFDNQPEGRFYWLDTNGDAKPQATEYTRISHDFGGDIQGYHVDAGGGLTFGMHHKGAARLAVSGLSNGIPQFAPLQTWRPAEPANIVRALFDARDGRLIVSGFDQSIQRQDGRVAGNHMVAYAVTGDQLSRLWATPLDFGFLPDQPRGIESITLPASLDILFAGDRTSSDVLIYDPKTGEHRATIKRDTKLHGDKGSFLDVTDAVDAVRLPDGIYRVVTENVWCQNMSVYDVNINSLLAPMRK